MHLILNESYFQDKGKLYIKPEGLVMREPTSSIFSETNPQHLEHNKIFDILMKYNIAGYLRYVDDIVITYKHNNDKHS